MKVDIEYLKNTFETSNESYLSSREEAKAVWDAYHNRQYTDNQLNVLRDRGQPAETFNVIKLFARLLVGFYSNVSNTATVTPIAPEDAPTASLLNDILSYIMRDNDFKVEGEKVKLGGVISGLMCVYIDVKPTGERDAFGRAKNKVHIEHVPDYEISLDPLSRKEDYSDARYIHRHRWLSEEAVVRLFGKSTLEKLTPNNNFTNSTSVNFDSANSVYDSIVAGQFRVYDNYLIIHSIVTDDKGDRWDIFWHDDVIIEKKKITHKDVLFPYRVMQINDSDRAEYYGIFREIVETQRAINQALIKLQQMVNVKRVMVEKGAVEDLSKFTSAINRVDAVLPVLKISGIDVDNMSKEIADQYVLIDKAFDRIQRVLGVTDSFLGMAFASDSGRKVKLQQNSTVLALRYLTGKVESFYRFLGWDVANLIKQYYTATQALRIAEDNTGQRWVTLNQPDQIFTGEYHPVTQEPIFSVEFEEVVDPASGEPVKDDQGNFLVAPIPVAETEIAFTNFDITIESNSFNDEDEKNQLMLESILGGPMGSLLSQVNPAGYFQVAGLSIESLKTKNSPEIALIFKNTARSLGGNPQAQQEVSQIAQGQKGQQTPPKSQDLKLPQNTNEGL